MLYQLLLITFIGIVFFLVMFFLFFFFIILFNFIWPMQTLTEKTTNIKKCLVRSQKLAKSTVVSMDELFQLNQVLRFKRSSKY